jgi:hypothetical protein
MANFSVVDPDRNFLGKEDLGSDQTLFLRLEFESDLPRVFITLKSCSSPIPYVYFYTKNSDIVIHPDSE